MYSSAWHCLVSCCCTAFLNRWQWGRTFVDFKPMHNIPSNYLLFQLNRFEMHEVCSNVAVNTATWKIRIFRRHLLSKWTTLFAMRLWSTSVCCVCSLWHTTILQLVSIWSLPYGLHHKPQGMVRILCTGVPCLELKTDNKCATHLLVLSPLFLCPTPAQHLVTAAPSYTLALIGNVAPLTVWLSTCETSPLWLQSRSWFDSMAFILAPLIALHNNHLLFFSYKPL